MTKRTVGPSFSIFHVELSQDVASKGLGLVYEMGGEADQQELVSTLVETLMTGKRRVGGVEDGVKEQKAVAPSLRGAGALCGRCLMVIHLCKQGEARSVRGYRGVPGRRSGENP